MRTRWMRRAVEVAKSAPGDKKVGCVATYKGKFVTEATNLPNKTHPKQAHYAWLARQERRIFLHSEIHVICRAREPIDELYVARIGKNGDLRMSKPCQTCQLAIEATETIKKTHYTTNNSWSTMEVG